MSTAPYKKVCTNHKQPHAEPASTRSRACSSVSNALQARSFHSQTTASALASNCNQLVLASLALRGHAAAAVAAAAAAAVAAACLWAAALLSAPRLVVRSPQVSAKVTALGGAESRVCSRPPAAGPRQLPRDRPMGRSCPQRMIERTQPRERRSPSARRSPRLPQRLQPSLRRLRKHVQWPLTTLQ